jgi:uncharacterized protein YdiU (UPF0061 family)
MLFGDPVYDVLYIKSMLMKLLFVEWSIFYSVWEEFAAREITKFKITGFTIKHHFPQIQKEGIKNAFFFKVMKLHQYDDYQLAAWFCSWCNEWTICLFTWITIDYGPYGWLEDYNPGWTNTTDRQHKDTVWQPTEMALWNLYQLAMHCIFNSRCKAARNNS